MYNLQFTENGHKYTINDRPALSISKIFESCGLADYSKIPKLKLERSQKFGSAVHKACELFIKGDLDQSKLDRALYAYLGAFRAFLAESGFKVLYSEKKIGVPILQVACRIDMVGELNNNIVIVEIKTPVEVRAVAEIQTAAQKYLWNHKENEDQNLPKIKDRYILQLKDDGKYRLKPCTGRLDENVFLACCSVCAWKLQNGIEL